MTPLTPFVFHSAYASICGAPAGTLMSIVFKPVGPLQLTALVSISGHAFDLSALSLRVT
jgi:hypothetical protein